MRHRPHGPFRRARVRGSPNIAPRRSSRDRLVQDQAHSILRERESDKPAGHAAVTHSSRLRCGEPQSIRLHDRQSRFIS